MKRPYQIAGLFFILLAAFLVWHSLELEFYTFLGPGPGFFPFWLSITLGLLAAFVFFRATWGKAEPMPAEFFPDRIGLLRMCAILLAVLVAILLLVPLGFRFTMLAIYLFLLYALGRVNPIVTVFFSLGGSFCVYHVFVEWLKIPLPIGPFGI